MKAADADVLALPLSAAAFHACAWVDEQPRMVLIGGLRVEGGIQEAYVVAPGGGGRWVPMREVVVVTTRVPVVIFEEV